MLKYRLKTKQKNYFKVIFYANYKIPERSVDRLRLCPIPATAGTPITFSAKKQKGQCILTETKKTDYSLSFEPVANLNRKPI